MTQVAQNSLSRGGKQSFSAFMTLPAVKQKVMDIVAGRDGTRFITAIVTAVSQNNEFANCDYTSILSAALLGEALKLSPSPQLGHFYLVPFKDKRKGQVAQFLLGYKGYIQLAIRSGQYRNITVTAIKEGELLGFNRITEEIRLSPIEDEIVAEQAETIGYYASFELINGFKKSIYWSKEKMKAHAKEYSRGFASDLANGTKYTFWSKDFDGMAYKTLIRQLISKWGIMSIDMQKAYSGDMAAIEEDGSAKYVETEEVFKDVSSEEPEALVVEEVQNDIESAFFGGGTNE